MQHLNRRQKPVSVTSTIRHSPSIPYSWDFEHHLAPIAYQEAAQQDTSVPSALILSPELTERLGAPSCH